MDRSPDPYPPRASHNRIARITANIGFRPAGKEWTQLDYGWWAVLEPHLIPSYKKETAATRQQARQNLEDETNALFAKLRQMRGQQ